MLFSPTRPAAAVVIVMLLLCMPLLQGCERDTDEDKVRETLTVIEQGVEKKDVRKVLSRVSKTYRDEQGNDLAGIKAIILFYFFRHPTISVLLHDIAIKVDGGAATADFEAVLTGNPAEARTFLPEAVGFYRFHVILVLESDAWKVQSAAWTRFDETRAEPAQ